MPPWFGSVHPYLRGAARALTALLGDLADAVIGPYEHTLRMQAKGRDILAVIELGRYPGIALGVKKDRADKIKSIADLKGAKIGITSPGPYSSVIVWHLMAKAGLRPDDASFVGLGASSAIAAIERGEIDAIAGVDPVISILQLTSDIVLLADTRTSEGTTKLLGGSMSAAVLYLKRDFMENYPNTVQALVNALYKGLKWLDKATPEEIADKVLSPEYWLPHKTRDKALYIVTARNNLQIYSRDGIVSAESQNRSMDFVKQWGAQRAPVGGADGAPFSDRLQEEFLAGLRRLSGTSTVRDKISEWTQKNLGLDSSKDIPPAKFDLAKTWDDRFVKRAAATVK